MQIFAYFFQIGVHLTGGSSVYFFQDISTDELREELPAHQPRYPFYVGTHMGRKSQLTACPYLGCQNLASTRHKLSATLSIMLWVFQISPPVNLRSDLSDLMNLCYQ